jgi:hypothetical protein
MVKIWNDFVGWAHNLSSDNGAEGTNAAAVVLQAQNSNSSHDMQRLSSHTVE